MEDDKYVLIGPPPTGPIPNDSIGKLLFDSLMENGSKKDVAMHSRVRSQIVLLGSSMTTVALVAWRYVFVFAGCAGLVTDALNNTFNIHTGRESLHQLVDAFTERTISYEYLLEKASSLAEALRRYGCNTSTVISISSENNLDFFVPVIASLFTGTILAPINQFYTSNELSHIVNVTKPKIIFVSELLAPKFVQVKQEFSYIERIIVFNSEKRIKYSTLQEFIAEMLGREAFNISNFQPWNGNTDEQTAFIMSSSGTTGLSKGVMVTHRNVATRLAQTWHPKYSYEDRSTMLAILPFFHGFGLIAGTTSIINKNKLVVMKQFKEDIFLSAIEKFRINNLVIVPPLAIFLAKTPKIKQYDVSSVQKITCGAAPLSKDIEYTLMNKFNLRAVSQIYGLTEATFAITIIENDVGRRGSCGTTITYMKVKLRCPKTGKSLAPHQTGEICIKGPMVTKGYYKNEEATKHTFTADGWLLTGDLGYYDNDGFFYIVDRLKELIKYKGFQVPPAELEAILINHPKVLDVGVAGLPDDEVGELPVAFVVKKVEDVTEKELQDFVAAKVSPQKRLRGGVKFLSSIPKNASGKILRRELKKILIENKKV